MVKVQKPIPKIIKKLGPGLKNTQIKKSKVKSTKDVAEKVKKTLEMVVKNEANDVILRNGIPTKKTKKVPEKVKETAPKKKPLVAKVQKSLKNSVNKKKSAIQEMSEPVEKVVSKKKVNVAKYQQPTKNIVESSVKEKVVSVGSIIQKKTTKRVAVKNSIEGEKTAVKSVQKIMKVKANTEQPFQNNVGKKRSGLEEQSVTVPKKKPIIENVHKTIKTVPKKKSALGEDSITIVNAKKNSIKTKVQGPAKKTVAKGNSALTVFKDVEKVSKKKPVPSKEQNVVQKDRIKANGIKKAGKQNLTLKVSKKVSTEKKAKTNFKIKVQKNAGEIKKDIQKEKDEKTELPLFEALNFNVDKFKEIIGLKSIKKHCKSFKDLLEKEVAEKKHLVFNDYTYILNIASFKIPNCPKRMVKLNLEHSIVDIETSDIVLIVPDMKMGAKVDYEPTIQHYEDLLGENGLGNITILPFNRLRNEFSSYEARKKFSNSYDFFLCDGRIVGHVTGFCGKIFQKPRKTIHAVNLNNPKSLKSAIEKGLKRTSFRQIKKGDLISIPVGSDILTTDQVAENIEKVIEQLKTIFPGGYANMRNIHIRADIIGTSSLPLYMSLSGAPEDVPNVIGPREQKMLKLKKQANDILSKFSMSKSGEFIKLNKAQVERKQKIREAREELTKEKNVEVNEECVFSPPLKKKLVEAEDTDDGVMNHGNDEMSNEGKENSLDETEVSDEDEDINDDSEEESEVDDEVE